MAHGGVRVMMQRWVVVVVVACVVASVSTASSASAFVFKAGGTGEWRVPEQASNVSAYNQWAEHNRFSVGDAISFSYQPGNDSVLLVDKNSYDACNVNSPIDRFADGNTVFTFTRSGPFYFISGNKDNCNRNEKLIVVVMGERAANGTAPAQAPSAGTTTSPNSPPSPPPPSGIEISPTPEQSTNAAVHPRAAAGIAGAAIGTLLYALV
ncbi:early nodulin-like protein 3 [Oryza brachyantha]|uniref:Phytocyanin domain-containing protein n=1 Tax=Oryza brachyantha TaxID=4533 RepID=J3L4T5_ORYBR|nr:early nodulin-like protein 3 [Oryza brachyantha]